MQLAFSINLSSILLSKSSVLENLISFGSFSNYIKSPKGILDFLKESNIKGIEIVASSIVLKRDIEKVKEILEEYNLSVFSVHQPVLKLYRISLAGIDKLLALAAAFSAKVVVLHLFAIGKRLYDPEFVKILKSLEEKYNIKIGLENGIKDIFTSSKTYCFREKEISEIASLTGLNLTLDTTHLAHAGGNIINFYRRNKGKIINIHLSDYKNVFFNRFFPSGLHLPLGEGELPLEEFLKILKEDNYNGILTLEINSGLKGIKKSVQFPQSQFLSIWSK
jgi:sugar phosphate isomerase/epimerase